MSKWETKTVPFELKSHGEDNDYYTFDGYMTVFGVEDRVGDKTAPGAFKRTIEHHNGHFPLRYGHQLGFFDLLGGAVLSEDNYGVLAKGRLPKTIESSERALAFLKMKVLNGMSYSYRVIKKAYEGDIRILKEVAVGEVTLGSKSEVALPETSIFNVKLFSDPEAIASLNELLRSENKALRDSLGLGDFKDDSALRDTDSALDLSNVDQKLIEKIMEVLNVRSRSGRGV
jgi:HK97 family phage prohead protease